MIALAPTRATVIRPAEPGDQAYVAATMADQLGRSRHDNANQIVDRVLDSPAVRVLVACDGARIVGYLVYASIPRVRAVLFGYVRSRQRLQGVARDLTRAAWPAGRGQWVHGGLRGGSTESVLKRFAAVEMPLDELL